MLWILPIVSVAIAPYGVSSSLLSVSVSNFRRSNPTDLLWEQAGPLEKWFVPLQVKQSLHLAVQPGKLFEVLYMVHSSLPPIMVRKSHIGVLGLHTYKSHWGIGVTMSCNLGWRHFKRCDERFCRWIRTLFLNPPVCIPIFQFWT